MRDDISLAQIHYSTYKNFIPRMEKSLSYNISSMMKCIMLKILIIMAKNCFGQPDNNFSQEINFYSYLFKRNETYNKKIRLAKCRTLYYALYHETPSDFIR